MAPYSGSASALYRTRHAGSALSGGPLGRLAFGTRRAGAPPERRCWNTSNSKTGEVTFL